MSELKHCCFNCNHEIRSRGRDGNLTRHCALDGHHIGYIDCLIDCCEKWEKDKKKEEHNV